MTFSILLRAGITKKCPQTMKSNEKHIQPIQYVKNINGTASLVEAISCVQKEYKSAGHYKIQFVSCSCVNVEVSVGEGEGAELPHLSSRKVYFNL